MNKRLIKLLPYSAKQGIKYIYGSVPYPIRHGKTFRNTYKFLKKSQWWSKDKLEEYQMHQLKNLMHHAYENTPYYRRVFDERNLKPNDIKDFDDLKKLPLLDRKTIRDNLPDLLARNYPKWRLKLVTTGGTTGVPLKFYQDRYVTESRERAFILTLWNRVGFEPSARCIALKRDVFPSPKNNRYWRYDPLEKTLILSSFHITDQNLKKYLERIREFNPHYIKAFPSVISGLAKLMKQTNSKSLVSIDAILCGSERLYPWQRKFLEEVFQCKTYSWYGHTEKAVLAGECEQSTNYHIFPEYGFTEFISRSNNPLTTENEVGEVVATGFNNYAMPLIRYRTGDLATLANQPCSCGRNYPLLKKIEGRVLDFILAKSHRLIPLNIVYYDSIEEDISIKQFQFYQEKPGEVTLRIIKKEPYANKLAQNIIKEMQKGLEGEVTFSIEYVENIQISKRGKSSLLIQKLPIQFGVDG